MKCIDCPYLGFDYRYFCLCDSNNVSLTNFYCRIELLKKLEEKEVLE